MMVLRLTQIAQSTVGSSLAELALGPIGLDADRLLSILQSFLILSLRGVNGGAVGVEDVVLGFNVDSLSEFLTGLWSASTLTAMIKWGSTIHGSRVVLVREGLVAFGLQSVSHAGMESDV